MTTVDLKSFVGPGKFAEDPDAIPLSKLLNHALGETSGGAVFRMFREKHPDLAFKKATGKRGQPEFCITFANLDLLQALADDDLAVREQEAKIKGWKSEAWHRAREPIVDFQYDAETRIILQTPREIEEFLRQVLDSNASLNEGYSAEIDVEKIQDAIKMEDPERQMFIDQAAKLEGQISGLQAELATANRRIGQFQRQRDARLKAEAQKAATPVDTVVQEIAMTVAPSRSRRRKVEQKPVKRSLFGWLLGRSA